MKMSSFVPFNKVLCVLGVGLIQILPITSAYAEDDEVVIESKITGSREQPKVLSVVPWQDPPRSFDMREDVKSVIDDDIMQPIDREAFIREANYYNRLFRDAQTSQPNAAAGVNTDSTK